MNDARVVNTYRDKTIDFNCLHCGVLLYNRPRRRRYAKDYISNMWTRCSTKDSTKMDCSGRSTSVGCSQTSATACREMPLKENAVVIIPGCENNAHMLFRFMFSLSSDCVGMLLGCHCVCTAGAMKHTAS
jgi:hypothetical protein